MGKGSWSSSVALNRETGDIYDIKLQFYFTVQSQCSARKNCCFDNIKSGCVHCHWCRPVWYMMFLDLTGCHFTDRSVQRNGHMTQSVPVTNRSIIKQQSVREAVIPQKIVWKLWISHTEVQISHSYLGLSSSYTLRFLRVRTESRKGQGKGQGMFWKEVRDLRRSELGRTATWRL
jgi:hypothetical protein